MTRTETTTAKTERRHHFLRTLAVVVAVAAALAMAFAGDALADKEGHHKKRPPVPAQGSMIAFTSFRDGAYEIYGMNPDGSGQKNLTNNAAGDTQPAVSPDGKKIAFVSDRDGNAEIYVMNADGSDQRNLTSHGDAQQAADDIMPTWSADGTKIAFASRRDGNYEIYTMDSYSGAEQENITKNPARDMAPDWSPDGVTIAFETNRDGNSEIYFMDSHGGNPYNLSGNPASDFGVNYAPDPYINRANRAFTRTVPNQDGGFNYEIYEMSYLGLYQSNLTNSVAMETDPSYSPDGKQIAFTTDRSGNEDIYVMNRDGSSPKQLTTHAASDFDPDWARSSTAPATGSDTAPPTGSDTSSPASSQY